MILLASGLLTGFLGGCLGIGGGVILVPLLMLFAYPWPQACAISLFCITLSSLITSASALPRKEVELKEALWIQAPGCLLSYLGYLFIHYLDGWGLKTLLACALSALATYNTWKVLHTLRVLTSKKTPLPKKPPCSNIPSLQAIGVYSLTGLASGMFAIGGGVIIVPWLHYKRGLSWIQASSTSSYAMGGLSSGALAGYLGAGEILWQPCFWAALGVMAGTYGGIATKRRVPPSLLSAALTIILITLTVMVWHDLIT